MASRHCDESPLSRSVDVLQMDEEGELVAVSLEERLDRYFHTVSSRISRDNHCNYNFKINKFILIFPEDCKMQFTEEDEGIFKCLPESPDCIRHAAEMQQTSSKTERKRLKEEHDRNQHSVSFSWTDNNGPARPVTKPVAVRWIFEAEADERKAIEIYSKVNSSTKVFGNRCKNSNSN